eukprot:905361-Rhodomonas_salina.1
MSGHVPYPPTRMLRGVCYAKSGTDIAYAATAPHDGPRYAFATSLRAPYAMSSTELLYGATSTAGALA